MILENIKLAFKSMLSNKLRTLLSLLGIVIGVMAVVTILTLGQSASSSITDSLDSAGTDLITLFARDSSSGIFTRTLGDDIISHVNGIETVLPMNSANVYLRYQKEISRYQLYATDSDWNTTMSYNVSVGSWFTAEQNINKSQVIILGSNVAEELFNGENPVGKSVTLYRGSAGKSYIVSGVMESKDGSLSMSYDDTVYIPFNTYIQRYMNTDAVGFYTIKVKEGFDAVSITDEIKAYLDTLITESRAYSVFTSATLVQIAEDITGTFSTFLAAIAGISLLVGGIGIMNIMLVSVAERTREIGVRKALGASPRVIRGQFLTEAVTLTLVGALIGIGFGILLSKVISDAVQWKLHLSVSSFFISAGFSMVIGIFFGFYPAHKASKLNPIVALSYE